MSPRYKRLRRVINPPLVKGFKPYGPEAGRAEKEPVRLHIEEYEALRLCDYDMYNHHEASGMMGVSRPTFTRIYSGARQKVALAFVEGRQIAIEGGKVYFDSDWYQCAHCHCYFNNPEKDQTIEACPLCGHHSVSAAASESDKLMPAKENDENIDFCVCPQCGYSQPHHYGRPCSHEFCPRCNVQLRRNTSPGFQGRRHRAGRNG